MIKEAAKLIGWLTGSLAGIVAILYACGYLIVQTQLHLMGIDALLPSGREYYLQEGAAFCIVTGQKLGLLVLGLVALMLIICIPISIVAKTSRGAAYFTRLRKRWLGVRNKHQWLWQAAALSVAVILLFFPLVYNLDLYRAPLELSGLLYATQDDALMHSKSSEAATVAGWVMAGNTKALDNLYFGLLMHCLFSGFMLSVVQRVTAAWPFRPAIVFPFFLVFGLYLLLLPLDYVVLEKRIEFPSVRFISTQEKVSSISGDLLLLSKTEQEFILWDQAQKTALWIPKDKMVKVEIGQTRPIFDKTRAKGREVR